MKKISTIACICFCILTVGIFFTPKDTLTTSLFSSNILSYEQQAKSDKIIKNYQDKYFTEDASNNTRYMRIFRTYFERKLNAKKETFSIQNKALIRHLITQANDYITYGGLPTLNSASSEESFVDDISTEQIRSTATKVHNELRIKNQQIPLLQSGTLHVVAQEYADRMCKENLALQHLDPDGNTAYDRITKSNANFVYYGENLAKGYTKVSYVLDGLMKSEGHRANVLHPKFTKIGVGYCDLYWVFIYTDK